MTKWVPLNSYGNEDGDEWVVVADHSDRDAVGQILANNTGLVYAFEGRESVTVSECECGGPQTECPDSQTGGPCTFREKVECWHFVGFDYPGEATDLDVADYPLADVYRPQVEPVVTEAPSAPMFEEATHA